MRRSFVRMNVAGAIVPIAILLLGALSAPAADRGVTRASILGVVPGMEIDQAKVLIERASNDESEGRNEAEGEEEAEERGARKLAWALHEGTYRNVAMKVSANGKVAWVTGFVRPGHEIPFSEFGDVASAARRSDTEMIWNFSTADGDRRVVLKGQNGKAMVVTLMSTDLPPVR